MCAFHSRDVNAFTGGRRTQLRSEGIEDEGPFTKRRKGVCFIKMIVSSYKLKI